MEKETERDEEEDVVGGGGKAWVVCVCVEVWCVDGCFDNLCG